MESQICLASTLNNSSKVVSKIFIVDKSICLETECFEILSEEIRIKCSIKNEYRFITVIGNKPSVYINREFHSEDVTKFLVFSLISREKVPINCEFSSNRSIYPIEQLFLDFKENGKRKCLNLMLVSYIDVETKAQKGILTYESKSQLKVFIEERGFRDYKYELDFIPFVRCENFLDYYEGGAGKEYLNEILNHLPRVFEVFLSNEFKIDLREDILMKIRRIFLKKFIGMAKKARGFDEITEKFSSLGNGNENIREVIDILKGGQELDLKLSEILNDETRSKLFISFYYFIITEELGVMLNFAQISGNLYKRQFNPVTRELIHKILIKEVQCSFEVKNIINYVSIYIDLAHIDVGKSFDNSDKIIYFESSEIQSFNNEDVNLSILKYSRHCKKAEKLKKIIDWLNTRYFKKLYVILDFSTLNNNASLYKRLKKLKNILNYNQLDITLLVKGVHDKSAADKLELLIRKHNKGQLLDIANILNHNVNFKLFHQAYCNDYRVSMTYEFTEDAKYYNEDYDFHGDTQFFLKICDESSKKLNRQLLESSESGPINPGSEIKIENKILILDKDTEINADRLIINSKYIIVGKKSNFQRDDVKTYNLLIVSGCNVEIELSNNIKSISNKDYLLLIIKDEKQVHLNAPNNISIFNMESICITRNTFADFNVFINHPVGVIKDPKNFKLNSYQIDIQYELYYSPVSPDLSIRKSEESISVLNLDEEKKKILIEQRDSLPSIFEIVMNSLELNKNIYRFKRLLIKRYTALIKHFKNTNNLELATFKAITNKLIKSWTKDSLLAKLNINKGTKKIIENYDKSPAEIKNNFFALFYYLSIADKAKLIYYGLSGDLCDSISLNARNFIGKHIRDISSINRIPNYQRNFKEPEKSTKISIGFSGIRKKLMWDNN